VDLDDLDAAFEQLEKTVAPKILRYYKTTCPLGHQADVMYVFWVKKVTCVGCGQDVHLFPSFRLASRKDSHTVFCPSRYHIFQVDDANDEARCEECGHAFVPGEGYTSRGYYTCPACGQRERVLDAVRRKEGPPEAEMFAIEYYCRTCEREGYDRRGYKPADDEDLALFDEAKAEFERQKDELLFPRQRVPHGMKTRDLLNYGYEYWHQMFNERQLLCLSTLLKEILNIRDENAQELMLLTLSDSLDYSNMLVSYHTTRFQSGHLFARHAYWVTSVPLENNPWGTDIGAGTFIAKFAKTKAGLTYALRPFERDGSAKKKVGDTAAAKLVQTVESLKSDGAALLRAQTAEDLSFIPDGSVDAVVTDPPYCLAPGTLIFTSGGYKPIEAIQVGDEVLSHKGRFCRVTKVYRREYSGELITIKVAHFNEPLRITPNHEVRVWRPTGWEWVPAGDIEADDSLMLPTLAVHQDVDTIRLSEHLPDYYCDGEYLYYEKLRKETVELRASIAAAMPIARGELKAISQEAGIPYRVAARLHSELKQGRKPQYKMQDAIAVDESFMRLVGYYLADGSASVRSDRGTLTFSFGHHEAAFVEDLKTLMEKALQVQTGKPISQPSAGYNIPVHSKPLAEFFQQTFGHEARQKHLPAWMLYLPDEKLAALVTGYWRGDGSKNRIEYRATTTSPYLAGQLKMILQRLGIAARVFHDSRDHRGLIDGRVIAGKDNFQLIIGGPGRERMAALLGETHPFVPKVRKPGKGAFVDGSYILPIQAIERELYDGMVYNLETEDHSYTTACGCVHNCDNVMYAELADFFYVWLRLALKDRYPAFEADYSPKAREIVKNDAQDKDEAFFFRGLTRVFRECNRVLKDDGLFVFTFHHKETWAWKSVLQAIVDAGFYVTAVYPIHSEMRTSTHLLESRGVSYDIPFVCRKRRGDGQAVSWEALKDEIYFAAQESVERIKTSGRSISDADLFVIVMGRCLELYSKHWPNVLKEGQQVDVDQAVDDLDDLVDSLIKSYELKLLPASLDDTTKLYLLYIAGQKTVSADELRKRLVTGGGSLDVFTKREYLLTRRKQMTVATPGQRMAFVVREMERDRDLPLVDIAHHLYATYKAGQPVQWLLGRWTRDELVAVLEHLYRKSGDRVWRSLAELTRSALAPTTKPLL